MFFLLSDLFFGFIVLIFTALTVYIYLRLVIAVKTGTDVPKHIYQIGQGFQGRVHVNYDDITNREALKLANLFLFCFFTCNIIFFIAMYFKTHVLTSALYACFKSSFAIAITSIFLNAFIKLLLLFITKNKPMYLYSPVNAIIGGVFITAFTFSLFISLTGFPAEPVKLQIGTENIIVGETKASQLLACNFQFADKTAESNIVNKRNDHFYYGELVEIFRNGKSYGLVSVTPKWKDSDKLKNCIITYYEISGDSAQLSAVKFNNQDLSKLQLQDFRTKHLKDIFALHPADYEEIKNDTLFILKLQTNDYGLWKRYRIESYFYPDGTPYRYGIRVQHTIWE